MTVCEDEGRADHFTGKISQHPVGRTFTGGSAYTDTQGEYLSSLASNTTDEMDCLDCHDQALIAPDGRYMQHQVLPANNPYMLKKVTAAGQYDNSAAPATAPSASGNWKIKGKGHPGRLPRRRSRYRERHQPRQTAPCCSRVTPARTGRLTR